MTEKNTEQRSSAVQTKREVLTGVRFGELEVPTDPEIVLGHLECHRNTVCYPPEQPSLYQKEMQSALLAISSPPESPEEAQPENTDEVGTSCSCTGFRKYRATSGMFLLLT